MLFQLVASHFVPIFETVRWLEKLHGFEIDRSLLNLMLESRVS